MKEKEQQIKNKKRVTDFGEVFTAEREVKAMCDLVKNETERIDSRFLEPACGNGNFLVEILNRKLIIAKADAKRNLLQFEINSFRAIASLYGVDLMRDNVSECRKRLYDIWFELYKKIAKKMLNQDVCNSIKYVLDKNIICGDALTLLKNDGKPIIFSEWSFISGSLIKRRDYELSILLSRDKNEEENLFNSSQWQYDTLSKSFIPTPIKTYPPTNFKEVTKYA